MIGCDWDGFDGRSELLRYPFLFFVFRRLCLSLPVSEFFPFADSKRSYFDIAVCAMIVILFFLAVVDLPRSHIQPFRWLHLEVCQVTMGRQCPYGFEPLTLCLMSSPKTAL